VIILKGYSQRTFICQPNKYKLKIIKNKKINNQSKKEREKKS